MLVLSLLILSLLILSLSVRSVFTLLSRDILPWELLGARFLITGNLLLTGLK